MIRIRPAIACRASAYRRVMLIAGSIASARYPRKASNNPADISFLATDFAPIHSTKTSESAVRRLTRETSKEMSLRRAV